tara:strand:+ start:1990 stop:2409 length:420 start_codon:yes stop_codon:yes gene_type:complete
MRVKRFTRLVSFGLGVLGLSSCAWIPKYISDPGVEIQTLPASDGRVTSAHFWRDDKGIQLWGEVVGNPVTKGPIGGHVDVAITLPDGEGIECRTTRQRIQPRHTRKPYFLDFDALPPPGSVVTVKHHAAGEQGACAHEW